MRIVTDTTIYTRELVHDAWGEPVVGLAAAPAPIRALAASFFPGHQRSFRVVGADPWRWALVTAHAASSQYGRLIELARTGVSIPDGLLCLAGTGEGFRGFRDRGWVTAPGNVHLTVHLAPEREIARFESVFMALAAVSVVEAIDAFEGLGGRAAIRWVNDIVLEGAKVGGVLCHTQTRGDVVTGVVLGIGVNVETVPDVRPTAFVPAATALRDHAPAVSAATFLRALLDALGRNYGVLLDAGFAPIVARYRARSCVLGRPVRISTDDPDERPRVFAAGLVDAIGDGLELHLRGNGRPVTRGRLLPDPLNRQLAGFPASLT